MTNAPLPGSAINSQQELIDLYWWMIDTGYNSITLENLSLTDEAIADVTDKFSNYFDAYTYSTERPYIYVVFKPGLSVLLAIEQNRVETLNGELRQIAAQALSIVAEVIRPDMTPLEKELALHDYIAVHCAYSDDADDGSVTDTRGFFQNGLCQCSGYVDTFRLLGRLAGLEVEMIGGPTKRDVAGSKGHAWNLVKMDGLWYVVDVTWDDMLGDNVPEHVYFNLPITCLNGSRSWDEQCSPQGHYADSLDANYYYASCVALTANEAFALAVNQLDSGDTAWILFPQNGEISTLTTSLSSYYNRQISCTALTDELTIFLFQFK